MIYDQNPIGLANGDGERLPWLCFTALESNSTVGLRFGGNLTSRNLKISYDAATWTQWDFSTVTLAKGEKVYLKGTNGSMAVSGTGWTQFVMTGRIAASGSVMTLLYENDPWTDVFICHNTNEYYFFRLFQYCTALEEPPELPARQSNSTNSAWKLGQSCYYEMFDGCTALKRAPKLPFKYTSSSCCTKMFNNCKSIIIGPELNAEDLSQSCYASMFAGCTSMVKGPSLVRGGENADNTAPGNCMMNMFRSCTSLVQAPELRAKYIAGGALQQMFSGCTSLKKAPKMPTDFYNTTANNAQHFYAMFDGCISMEEGPSEIVIKGQTVSAPWRYMFRNCVKLKKAPSLTIEAPIQVNSSVTYGDMFYNCTALEEPPERLILGDTTSTCINMFSYCTSLKKAPRLVVSDLSLAPRNQTFYGMFMYCTSLEEPPDLPEYSSASASMCQNMFSYCTSLKHPPRLPYMTLASSCYNGMFAYCYSLKSLPELPATTLADNCYQGMFKVAGDAYSSDTGHIHLPATALKNGCYANMFSGCKAVKSVKMDFTSVASYSTSTIGGMFSSCLTVHSIEVAFTAWGSSSTWRSNWCQSANANVTFIKPAALPTTTAGNSTYLSTWTIVNK